MAQHNDDRDMYVETGVENYINSHKINITDLIDDTNSAARQIRVELISEINEQLTIANTLRDKGSKLRLLTNLPGYAAAMLLISTGDVKRLALGATGYNIVVKRYYKKGNNWQWSGTYEIVQEHNYDNAIMRAMSLLIPDASAHDENSMLRYLACHAPGVTLHNNNKLVYFRNGVWDYRNKTLTAYDDPSYETNYGDTVALAKLPVYHPYGAGAVLTADANGHISEPVIHNSADGTDWRPTNCFEDPFALDTAEGQASSKIMWQLLQFLIRHMNGSPHLYHFWIDADGKGHNGKSTLWECMQRLIKKEPEPGDEDLRASGDTVINCAIENLEKDYVLAENIKTAYAIIGEESNGATSYIENCAMIKMLSRAQEFTFRQIRQSPFSFRYDGALIQQLNKPPLFSEKTDSMYTHSVNIPFSRSFDDSRPYIKDDYILREEVAEWLAYHVTVEMDALDAYDTEALKTLEPFKREMLADGMSTMQALDDIVPGLRMNFMPSELLYDLYIRWCDKNGVCGRAVVSAKVFRDDLEQYGINNNYNVEFTKKYARTSTKDTEQEHPAMVQYGHSNRSYSSQYVRMEADMTHYRGSLNASQFVGEDGRGRLWTKGGLKRNTNWQEMEKTLTAEIDEDAE